MKIAHKIETYTSDGEPVLRFTVMNSSGVYMEFTNWGARWITASVPDVQGALDNVLIGYDSLAGYLEDSYYMGATIGRFANRIADASFTIDRKTFHLEANDGNNTNHGGFSDGQDSAFLTVSPGNQLFCKQCNKHDRYDNSDKFQHKSKVFNNIGEKMFHGFQLLY